MARQKSRGKLTVRERIAAGDSDQEVKDFLVARYGDFAIVFEAIPAALARAGACDRTVALDATDAVGALDAAIEAIVNSGTELQLYSVNNITSGGGISGTVTVRTPFLKTALAFSCS